MRRLFLKSVICLLSAGCMSALAQELPSAEDFGNGYNVFVAGTPLGTLSNYAVVSVGGDVSITSDFQAYQSATVITGNVGEGPHTDLQHGIDATINGQWHWDPTDSQNPATMLTNGTVSG